MQFNFDKEKHREFLILRNKTFKLSLMTVISEKACGAYLTSRNVSAFHKRIMRYWNTELMHCCGEELWFEHMQAGSFSFWHNLLSSVAVISSFLLQTTFTETWWYSNWFTVVIATKDTFANNKHNTRKNSYVQMC